MFAVEHSTLSRQLKIATIQFCGFIVENVRGLKQNGEGDQVTEPTVKTILFSS
jgi:hypothetical protein